VKGTRDSEGEFEDEGDWSSPEADDAGVFWCPNCGGEMYGDSTRCPACGDYVSPGARPSSRMPRWIRAGLVLVGLTLVAGLVVSFLASGRVR
jgi:hypothetical protein